MHRRLSFKAPIATSLLIALVLSVIALPVAMKWWEPMWMLLVLMAWSLLAPERLPLWLVWFCGVLIDLFSGTLLGLHAFLFSIATAFLKRSQHGFNSQPGWLRSVTVVMLLFAVRILEYLVLLSIGDAPKQFSFWLPFVSSAAFWPIVYGVLSRYGMKGRWR